MKELWIKEPVLNFLPHFSHFIRAAFELMCNFTREFDSIPKMLIDKVEDLYASVTANCILIRRAGAMAFLCNALTLTRKWVGTPCIVIFVPRPNFLSH